VYLFTIKKKTMKKTILATLILIGTAGATYAGNGHPRRHEVNSRLANQNKRIDRKEDDGKMSKKEANKLHKEDHQIRQEERDMASQNGGHITKQEQKTLNQQENHVSRQIKNH
jgi:hypothetical protein